MSDNPFVEKANGQRSGSDRIVSPQESHKNGKVGEAGANPGSSYKPTTKDR